MAITPIHVDDAELARRQARYDRLSPEGVTVRLEDLGDGDDVPRALDSAEAIVQSEQLVAQRLASADVTGIDAFLPDCVLDPAIEMDGLARPVLGIGRLAAHVAVGMGGAIGAVARNSAIASELDRRLRSYGLPPRRPTVVLNLSLADIADEQVWAGAVERVLVDLDCAVVLNACSAVEVAESAPGPVLLDPTRAALRAVATWPELVTAARSSRTVR